MKQPAFANKCDARRAWRCGRIAGRGRRLAVFVLQNKSTAQKGAQGGGRSHGKQRSAAPSASQARQGGPRRNAPPRYVNHTHITQAHERGKQRRQPRCARAQGRPSNRKSEHHLRLQGRAAAAAPAHRAAVHSTIKRSPSQVLAIELELELIQPHMAQKPVLRGEVGCRTPLHPAELASVSFAIALALAFIVYRCGMWMWGSVSVSCIIFF